jgi:NAD(P)-dependent dehydrogenase (short-subunit alcohol dehydrogenase family)
VRADTERGRHAVRKLEQTGLSDVHFIEIDVTKQDTITSAAQAIEAQYGRLDVLMNNAGINLHGDGLPSAADPGVVQRVFDTNFLGALRVAQTMTRPLCGTSLLARRARSRPRRRYQPSQIERFLSHVASEISPRRPDQFLVIAKS